MFPVVDSAELTVVVSTARAPVASSSIVAPCASAIRVRASTLIVRLQWVVFGAGASAVIAEVFAGNPRLEQAVGRVVDDIPARNVKKSGEGLSCACSSAGRRRGHVVTASLGSTGRACHPSPGAIAFLAWPDRSIGHWSKSSVR